MFSDSLQREKPQIQWMTSELATGQKVLELFLVTTHHFVTIYRTGGPPPCSSGWVH